MGLIESQGTLLCIGFAIAIGAFIIQFLLCITKVHLYIKLIPLYLLGMYALFILLVLTDSFGMIQISIFLRNSS